MKIKKIAKVLILACMIVMAAGYAFADDESNKQDTIDINVICKNVDGTKIIEGMEIDLYCVGKRLPDGSYEFNEEFKNCVVPEADMNSSELSEIAESLLNVIKADDMTAVASAKSGADGVAVFENVTDGIYIIYGGRYEYMGYAYEMSPVLFESAAWNRDNDTADLSALAKISEDKLPENPVMAEYTIKKVWSEDEGHEINRSSFVDVDIFCDGKLFASVLLNEDNDWKYSWTGDSSKEWSCKEVTEVDGYKVLYADEETTFLVQNVYFGSSSSGGDEPGPGTTTPDDKLPQTGQFWWPVPVLFAVGVILVATGILIKKAERRNSIEK